MTEDSFVKILRRAEGLLTEAYTENERLSAEIKANDRRYRMAQDRANNDIERLSAENSALVDALEQAMEWNWGEESEDIPKEGIWKCENALRLHYGEPVSTRQEKT